MKIKIDWTGVPKELRPQLQAMVDKVAGNAALSDAFEPRGFSTFTMKFSESPGGISGANGLFSAKSKTLTMQSELTVKDGKIFIRDTPKEFFETLVHEVVHAAYPNLTDGADIHAGNRLDSNSNYLVGEFVFRSLTVSYIEKIFGAGSAKIEAQALGQIIEALQNGPYAKSLDWDSLTSEQLVDLIRDKKSPLSKLLPEATQITSYFDKFYDGVPDNHHVIYGHDSAFAYVPEGSLILDYTVDGKGRPVKVSYERFDGVNVDMTVRTTANGNTIKVEETITYPSSSAIGDGATIRQIVKYDTKGHETGREIDKFEYDGTKIQLGTIGNILGSQIGTVLGENSLVTQIGLSTLIGTFTQNLGDFIQTTYRLSNPILGDALGGVSDPLGEALKATFSDFGTDLTNNLGNQIIGQISALLMTELAEALDLNGFERGLFTSVGTTITNQVLTNVKDMVFSKEAVNPSDLFKGFTPDKLFGQVAGAVGGFLGSYIASQVLIPDNAQASIGTSIGSSIGAYVGGLVIPIPGLGSFVGAFLGNILGTLLGNAVGVDEKSWGSVYIAPRGGRVFAGEYGSDNSGDWKTFTQITQSQADTVNRIVDLVGAQIIGLEPGKGNGKIGYYQKGKTYTVYMPTGLAYDFVSRHTPDPEAAWAAVADDGVMRLLRNAKLQGGDFIKRWAFDNSKAQNVGTLLMDIEAAKSYLTYLRDAEKINILIKEAPKSSFAMGWALTLLRAKEMKLDTLKEFEQLGDAKDNVVRGLAIIDKIWGRAGNDAITGKGQDDVIHGDAGSDTINGGADNDTVYGDADSDTLRGAGGKDSLYGGDAADRLDGDEDDDILKGEQGRDVLYGDAGDDRLYGGLEVDSLYGGAGNDLLQGDEGDDRLDGGSGDDRLFGEDGEDNLRGYTGDDRLDGDAGRDELRGDAGNDTLSGGADLDWINGGDGNDVLSGGDGDDSLVGGKGDDRFVGGEGKDLLYGGDGRDTISGGAGNDEVRGEAGDDTISGQDGNDDLDGGFGNDVIHGGDGQDALLGSDGNDVLMGDADNDGVVGDEGDDVLYGGTGQDTMRGGQGNDLLSGDDGNDFLMGGTDNDTLSGGQGNDELYGDDGIDALDGGAGGDTLWGGLGSDILLGGEGNDNLDAGDGNDSISGGAGDDMLAGGAGDDTLDAAGGHDQLFGGAGNDILIGGPDVDYIDGGAGTDTIVLTGRRMDYEIRFNSAIGRYSIVDLRAGSPDGTDLADIENFSFSDGQFTAATLNYVTDAASELAWNIDNSDGSRSIIGWLVLASDPTKWDAYVRHFNLAGVKMSETVIKHDGSRIAYAWDANNTETWSSYTQIYDTKARLTLHEYLNDNGTKSVQEWDHTGAQVWFTRLTAYDAATPHRIVYQKDTIRKDALGLVASIERGWDYSSYTVDKYTIHRDEGQRILWQEYLYDDGSRTVDGWDYERKETWKEFHQQFDTQNRQTYEIYKNYSPVQGKFSSTEKIWDYTTAVWKYQELHRDHLNRLNWQQHIYDDKTSTIWSWDVEEAHLWSEDQTNFDGDGQKFYRLLRNDDNSKVEWQWDTAHSQTWSSIETHTNSKGKLTQKETVFDTGSWKIEKWDPEDAETWTQYSAEYDSDDRMTAQIYYQDDGSREEQKWDRSDDKDWFSLEEDYDKNNRLTREKYVNDDKTSTEHFWDRNDSQDWSDYEVHYDAQSRQIWKRTTDDDVSFIIEETDYANESWSTRLTKGSKYGGIEKPYYQQTFLDSGFFTETRFFWDAGDSVPWALFSWSFRNGVVMAAVTTFDNGVEAEFLPLEVMHNPEGWIGFPSLNRTFKSGAGMTMEQLLQFDANGDGGIDLKTELPLARTWLENRLAEEGYLMA